MRLSGVVVWYNPGIQEVNNIKSYLYELDKLFIVDNSIENNEQLLDILDNNCNIEYISNRDNLGIAKALNIGCKNAIEQGYNWILTMDQDSEFEENIIEKYKANVEKMIKKDSSIAIYAPITQDIRGQKSGYINRVITSGNILNLNTYKVVNGFDNDLFIDEVDHDFCFKIIKEEYRIYQFSDILLKHKLGASKKVKILNKSVTAMNHNYIRKYYIVRNRCIIKKRYPEYTRYYTKSNISDLVKVILVEEDKLRRIKYMLKGYLDYKKNKLGKIDI